MHKSPLLALSIGALLFAGAASAGEVKGPPGTIDNTNRTGAPAHANSACAYSGLNDLDSEDGQNLSHVQTAADAWKIYGLPHGITGWGGACRGGTNEGRQAKQP